MNRFASWHRILLPALVTFSAGFLLGQSLPKSGSTEVLEELPLDLRAYAEAMMHALALEPAQADDLRVLLFHYERERKHLLEQQWAAVDGEWVDLDQRFESLLAYRILRPEQRQLAKGLRHGRTVVPSAAPR